MSVWERKLVNCALKVTTKPYRKDVTVTRRTQERALVDGDQYSTSLICLFQGMFG
jgi:hypothetical protein